MLLPLTTRIKDVHHHTQLRQLFVEIQSKIMRKSLNGDKEHESAVF